MDIARTNKQCNCYNCYFETATLLQCAEMEKEEGETHALAALAAGSSKGSSALPVSKCRTDTIACSCILRQMACIAGSSTLDTGTV